MDSLVTRLLIALSTWLGLAVLGLGPRAVASFIVAVSPPAQIDGDGGAPDSAGPADPVNYQLERPAAPGERPELYWVIAGMENSSSGAAGSSSGSSTGPMSQAFDLVAARLTRPTLVTRLDSPEALFASILLTAAIFEPPRWGR